MDRKHICRANGSEEPLIMLDDFQIHNQSDSVFNVIKNSTLEVANISRAFSKEVILLYTNIPIERCPAKEWVE